MATQDTVLSFLATLIQAPLPSVLKDKEAWESLASRHVARKTTVPEHYRLLHRCSADDQESVWAVLYRRSEFQSEIQIGARICREKACALAWEHRDNPELFESSEDRILRRT